MLRHKALIIILITVALTILISMKSMELLCGEKVYRDKQHGSKFLIVGSAPYTKGWTERHLAWFVNEGYLILPINNARKLIPLHLINEWHKPGDYEWFGSFDIIEKELEQMQSVVTHCNDNFGYWKLYKKIKGGGTMFFNLLYYLVHKYKHPITVVVVGNDMIYRKEGDTFYSHLPNSKAKNDPINKWNEQELSDELLHIQSLYQQNNHTLLNASDQEQTKLPFPRFTAYK